MESESEAYSRSPSPVANNHLFEDENKDGRIVSENEDNDRDSGGDHSEAEEEKVKKKNEKKKSNKPKGPVRRMLISEDMLSGRNGLTKVTDIFKDFKFRGKGQEKEDLNRMLSKYEQWIHMLHPKYPFDQCLERIEFLGLKKKPVKTILKKIRMGLISSDDFNRPEPNLDDDDDENLFPTTEDNVNPSGLEFNDEEINGLMEEMENESNAPLNNKPSGFESNDEDIDGMMDEMNKEINSTLKNQVNSFPTEDVIPSIDEQLELEQELNTIKELVQQEHAESNTYRAPSPSELMDDDTADNSENTTLL